MAAPSSFAKAQQVVNIQNDVLGVISGQFSTRGSGERDLSRIIKDREIDELKKLRDFFKKQEKTFYKKIGVPITEYKGLYEKTRKWNESGINNIQRNKQLVQRIIQYLNTTDDMDFFNNINRYIKDDLPEEIMKDAISEGGIFEEIRDEIKDMTKETIKTSFKGANKKIGREGFFAISFEVPRGEGKRKFTKLEKTKGITFYLNPKKGRAEIRFTHDIPKAKREDILDSFKEKMPDIRTEGTGKGEKYEGIYSIISSYLKGIEGTVDKSIIKDFEKVILKSVRDNQEVNFNKNSNVIYGALEELYIAAFAKYFGFPYQLVGHLIKSKKTENNKGGKEIPVDIIFEGAGAQIKSYYENEGVVTFNQHFEKKTQEMVPNSISLHSFLSGNNYLQLADPLVFGSFYFSEVYNKYNKEIANGDTSYESIWKRFEPIRKGIKTYAESSLDKLLNFNHEIAIQSPDLINTNLLKGFEAGRPTFFFINGKPIPTSAMIDDIINSLSEKGNEILIKIQNFDINTSSFNKATNGKKWPEDVSDPDVMDLLKKSKVEYTIDVDVNKLINRLLTEQKNNPIFSKT